MNLPRARLQKPIPPDRYRVLSGNSMSPMIGDVVNLDQGYTSDDGQPMVLVYCLHGDGSYRYEAEVYEVELSPC